MSTREVPPDSPLSTRDDALGALLRKSNEEFAAHIDRHASLRRLEARLNQPARSPRFLPVLACAPALLMLLWFAWSRVAVHEPSMPAEARVHTQEPSAPPLEREAPLAHGKTALPDGSRVEVSAGSHAHWRRTRQGIRVRLGQGAVRCSVQKQRGDQRFVVEAGDYAFVVLGTELSVRRSAQGSELEVASGRVEVRRGNHTLAFVTAGGSWRGPALSDAAAVEPSKLPAPPPALPPPPSKPRADHGVRAAEPAPAQVPAEDCAALVRSQSFAAADGCYARAAQGTGLSAELALFELSRVRLSALHDAAGALRALEEHQRRFPAGALARQVQLARVRTLAALGRFGEAVQALEPMLASGGPQQAELQALKAELERKQGAGADAAHGAR